MRGWAALATALACGCANLPPPRVGEPPPVARDAASEQAYQGVLARFTAKRAIYEGLETQLFVAATLEGPAFVEARVRREGEFKSASAAEVAAALEAERARLSGATEVLFGVHASDRKLDDFDRPNSIWRLALAVGGEERRPLEVKRLGKATRELRSLYPYLDDFWVAYRLRFPGALTAGQGAVLEVASTAGQARLEFRAE